MTKNGAQVTLTAAPYLPQSLASGLVDDDEGIRTIDDGDLANKGFEVVAAVNVTEASETDCYRDLGSLDVLITDLQMPNPSDGFAVITAMRQIQPKALRLLISGHPGVKSAMDAFLLEADEIIFKAFETEKLAALVNDKLLNRKPSVSGTLNDCIRVSPQTLRPVNSRRSRVSNLQQPANTLVLVVQNYVPNQALSLGQHRCQLEQG